ncbi:MAG: D-alanyl-D-alanine carboxypeptidase [Caulobacteraceae bacterium]
MYQAARRAFFAFLLALSCALVASPPALAQVNYNELYRSNPRYAAILVDAQTGEVLYSRQADSPRYPASITKIMTLYLAFEALQQGKLSVDDRITVSARAAAQSPTKLGLRAGETIRVDDALRAIAVKSANDMAVALAEHMAGSESRFAALMTVRAQELGMTGTRFVNASGLPDSRQISSARDIAILSRAVMRDFPQRYSYFGQRSFTYRGQTMNNHNHLLDSMPGVDGLKTGFTNASGYNLAASAVQNGRRLIAVVMGGSTWSSRDTQVEDLLRTGFTVMAQRDRGERVQVAQANLFDRMTPSVAAPVQYAQGDEDSADHGGLRIQVTDEMPKPYRTIGRSAGAVTTNPAPAELREPEVVKAVAPAAPKPRKATPKVQLVNAEERDCRLVTRTFPAKSRTARGAKGKARTIKTQVCESAVADKAEKASLKGKPGKGPRGGKLIKASDTKAEPKGTWAIQVGAFKDRASAKTQLTKVSAKFSTHIDDARPQVGAANGMYRARYVGLTASDAKAACAAIKAKGGKCLALSNVG